MEEHPLSTYLIDHCCVLNTGVEKDMPSDLLVVQSQPLLMEVESNIQDGYVEMAT